MKKEDFYRNDILTFKPKYHLLCNQCEFKIIKNESREDNK